MYYLFLDDERRPQQVIWASLPQNVSWVIAKNYDQFREAILNMGIPKFISFDCDLAPEHYAVANRPEFLVKQYQNEFKEKTGIDCAIYLANHCKMFKKPVPEFVVHSMNKIGGAEIKRILEEVS